MNALGSQVTIFLCELADPIPELRNAIAGKLCVSDEITEYNKQYGKH
jgi:hypothetical protein